MLQMTSVSASLMPWVVVETNHVTHLVMVSRDKGLLFRRNHQFK